MKEKGICSTVTGWKADLKAEPVITESFPELFFCYPRTCRIVTVECLSIVYDCRCHGSHSFFLCCHSYSQQDNCTTSVAAVKFNSCPNSVTLVWLVDRKGCYLHGIFLGGSRLRQFQAQFLQSFGKPDPNSNLWNCGKLVHFMKKKKNKKKKSQFLFKHSIFQHSEKNPVHLRLRLYWFLWKRLAHEQSMCLLRQMTFKFILIFWRTD